MQIKILYEDNDLFVVHKPAGIAVQSARVGQMDLENELRNYLAQKGEAPFVALVHRLDQPVEGVLVVAKNKKAAAELNKQLINGTLNKTYLAVVYLGNGQAGLSASAKKVQEEGTFTDYMLKDGKLSKIVHSNTEGAKVAKLHYTIIRKKNDLALVKVEIETGRFHQIRCQMAYHNMPLLGDAKYGTEESIYISRNCNVRNVALCANEITFKHLTGRKELHFAVEPMNSAFKKL